ncbi:unnamed protein product [Linum trigynum]|uniref:Uncharacterized protein n=1 Tax=Linum trigynum TaxID=586398 RepID=A0AAV2GJ34_9ROSI
MDGGSRVRTRTSSLVAGDDPASEFAHRVETLNLSRQQEPPVESSMPKEWTNEEHRLYLKSMESTFVDQLYGYIDPKLSRQQQFETMSTPSGQFKVLRRGCWQKVDFQRPGGSRVNTRAEAQGFLKSPWIQHFRCVKKPHSVGAQQQDPQNSQGFHSSSNHHDHSNNNYTEMSDQNFVDEDMEEDDDSAKGTSSTCSSKRIKVVVVNDHAPRSDQVVPFRHSPAAMVVDSADHKCIPASR